MEVRRYDISKHNENEGVRRMSQLKEERQYELIMKRGFPYPWDFHLGSESDFAGKDYEKYWKEKELKNGD